MIIRRAISSCPTPTHRRPCRLAVGDLDKLVQGLRRHPQLLVPELIQRLGSPHVQRFAKLAAVCARFNLNRPGLQLSHRFRLWLYRRVLSLLRLL